MYDTYIREMVEAIIDTQGVLVESHDNRLYETLLRYWSDYAVSIFDVNDVKEAAEEEGCPMSLSAAREILYLAEEAHGKGADLSKASIQVAVEDWAREFKWFDSDDPIPYEEFNMGTCTWATVIVRKRGIAQDEVVISDPDLSLAEVIRLAKKHDSAAQVTAIDEEERFYAIFALDDSLKSEAPSISEVEKSGLLVFETESSYFEGFGKEPTS